MARKFYEELMAKTSKDLQGILEGLMNDKVVEIDLAEFLAAGTILRDATITGFKAPDVSDEAIDNLNKLLNSAKGKEAQMVAKKAVSAFATQNVAIEFVADDINYRCWLNVNIGNIHRCLWTLSSLFRSLGINAAYERVSAVEAMRWVVSNLEASIGKKFVVCAYPNGAYTNYCFGKQAEAKYEELQKPSAKKPSAKKPSAKKPSAKKPSAKKDIGNIA